MEAKGLSELLSCLLYALGFQLDMFADKFCIRFFWGLLLISLYYVHRSLMLSSFTSLFNHRTSRGVHCLLR